MQTVIGINQETALKITNSKYYIPSGRSLQKREFIDDELIANSSAVADTLFQTKAGRTVIGGGGIGPDVIVKDEGSYPLAASILRSRGYFKFVQENNNQYSSIDEVLADEEFKYFQKYSIERSWFKLFLAGIYKTFAIFPALIRGFMPIPLGGYFNTAVTDIMINEEGIVEEVLYAKKHAADHFAFNKVKEFSLN